MLLGKTAPNGDRIAGLMDYVPSSATGEERAAIDEIAKEVFEKWVKTFPYSEQVAINVCKEISYELYLFLRESPPKYCPFTSKHALNMFCMKETVRDPIRICPSLA